MKILFGTDHAGFALKEALKAFVRDELGHEVEDMGAFSYDEQDDYPDFVSKVAASVGAEPDARGIVLGGSGQGEAMVANRHEGVRAAVYYGGTTDVLRLSREHNDANILSLGARFLTQEEAKEAVRLWLVTPFGGQERHVRRIQKIRRR
ncbi:MAG: RpiB/LacA/LacB family sugar-phosphate isomerase [Patescibacteria group bacterium]|nr:RpiB/LacA/LacB family sugar-phosphate isomerase [Patescibacteria group bacterium]